MQDTASTNAPPLAQEYAIAQLPARIVWPLLALLFFVLFLRPVPQGDIWFILLMGKKTIDNLAVPHHEFFLYTADGAPDLFGAWGYGVLMELARRATGLSGLIALNALLWSAAVCINVLAIRIRIGKSINSPFSWSEIASFMLGLSLLFEAIVQRTMLRPEVTMFIAWSLGCLLFEQAKRSSDWRKPLLLYPLLIWLEAWLHTAGPILLLPLCGYAVEYAWNCWRENKITSVKSAAQILWPWAIAILAGVILPIFNPNGIAQVYMHLHMLITGMNQETAPFNPGMPIADKHFFNLEYFAAWEWPPFYRLYALVFSAIGLSLLYEARLLVNSITLIPLAIFGVLHVRGIGLLAWGALIPIGTTINEIGTLIGKAHKRGTRSWRTSFLQQFVTIGSIIFLFSATIKYDLFIKWPLIMPLAEGLAQIRSAYPDGGNVFTDHHLGALTAWSLGEKYKVPVSAHIMVNHAELSRHFVLVSHVDPGWEEDLKRYNVIAVVTRATNLSDAMANGLPLQLLFNPQWRLADIQEEGATFIRLHGDEAPPPPTNRLANMQAYWTKVAKIAETSFEGLPLPRTKSTIDLSNKMLAIIKAGQDMPEATIAAMQQEAEKSAFWTMEMLKDK